ncbi:AAA family ATPase, partial [Acidobacteriota bacterium]
MQPIKLTLQAFGPYAEKQVIDFQDLRDRSFFLIHGPTGSGKTTILDGICFALYGDTSGLERTARQMRSDHVREDIITEVTLDFSLGNSVFRVYRSPEQDRLKKRGEGSTIEKAKATLWKLANPDDGENGNIVLASRYSEVSEKIEELLGLRVDQFHQVIMLPQGKFREFLLANSKDREEILETLFRTERYRFIQEGLKDAAKDIKEQRELILKRKINRLEDAEVESIKELKEKRKIIKAKASELKEDLNRLRKTEKEAQTKLNEGQQVFAKIEELKDGEALFDALNQKRVEFKAKQRNLDKARKALPLIEIEAALQSRIEEVKSAVFGIGETEKKLETSRNANEIAQKELNKEEGKEKERTDLGKEITRLEELYQTMKKLGEDKADLRAAEEELKRAGKNRDDMKNDIQACRNKLKEKEKDHLRAEKKAAAFEGLENALKEAEKNYRQREELEKLRRELSEKEKAYRSVEGSLAKAESDYKKARVGLLSLQEAWNRGQANILASKLEPGKPCPVCGSTEHPAPAHYDDSLPNEGVIKDKSKDVDEWEKKRDSLRLEETTAERAVENLKSGVHSLEKNLGILKETALSAVRDLMEKATNARNEAKQAELDVPILSKDIEGLLKKEKELKKNLENREEELERAIEKRASVKSIVDKTQSGIPEGLRKLSSVQEAEKRARDRLDELNKAYKEAAEKVKKAGQELSACEAALKEKRKTLKTAEESERKPRDRFTTALKTAGFKNIEDFRNARLTPDDIDSLGKEIKTYETDYRAAEARMERARKAAENLETPDINKLEEEAEQAGDALEKVMREETMLTGEIKHIGKWLKELKQIEGELKSLEIRYFVLGHIADVANGKNALGITFQRFVQISLLDDVLLAAS